MNFILLIFEIFFKLSEKTRFFLYRDVNHKKVKKIIFFIFVLLIFFLRTKMINIIYNILLLLALFLLYLDISKNSKVMLASIRGFLKYSLYFTFFLSILILSSIGEITSLNNHYFLLLFLFIFVITWCFISCCTEKNIGKIVNESLSIISGVILGVSCHIIEINTLFNEEIVNNKEFIHIKLLIISGSIFFLILFGTGTLFCILKEYWLEKHHL